MADKAISDLTSTTTTSGGYVEISIPDGSGGWLSRKITHSSFVAALQSSITTLQTYDSQATQTTKHASKSADFTQILGSNVKLESIDIVWVSGTPSIEVGTSLAANDIISGRTPTSGNPSINLLAEYFGSSTTLYFAVSGGTVNINVNYRENYI